MGFDRLKFTKEWTDHAAFPTVETDEAKVRADMQVLHDEAKAALNRLMDALEAAESAAKLGAVGPQGENSTVQKELDGLHDGMIKAGALPVGGSVEQMLVKSSEENYDTRWASIAEIVAAIRGKANGVASLSEEGVIPVSQISKLLRDRIEAGLSWRLIDTLDGTTGFSGEWVAPDVFGDGSAYDLGVYMISGAESGGAVAGVYKSVDYGESNDSNPRANTAEGGSSGNALNHIFKRVSPGASYAWVVGKGGAAKSGTLYGGYDKNPGGSTAFGGVTVSGGSDENSVTPYKGEASKPKNYYGGLTGTSLEREILNVFEPTMITLAHGMYGWARFSRYEDTGDWNSNKGVQTPAVPNPTIGVLGTGASKISFDSTANVSAKGVSGTRGNGGGGAVAISASGYSKVGTATATSGAGGDGVIFLYARKVVSE